MPKRTTITHALANSLLTALYVILVGTFVSNGQKIFAHEPSTLIPITMLLLFVFSAALCGSLMFGRPVLWYLDGKKKEALSLLVYSLVFFFLVAVIIFVAFQVLGL